MGDLARQPSIAEVRRAAAVGGYGQDLGLAFVPGVAVADVLVSSPGCPAWMPLGHISARVWAADPKAVWAAIQGSPLARGFVVVLEVYPVTRWARARAWWRWTMHRLEQALEARGPRP